MPLPPGTYRLNVVAKDITGGNMNNYEMALNVPHFDEEKLASSTIVLADLIEKVPTKNIGTGQFVIGAPRFVRAERDVQARREDGDLRPALQFRPDEKTQKPNGSSNTRSSRTARTKRYSSSPRN